MAIITKHFVKPDVIGSASVSRRRLLGLWFDLCQHEAGVLAASIVAPVGNALSWEQAASLASCERSAFSAVLLRLAISRFKVSPFSRYCWSGATFVWLWL